MKILAICQALDLSLKSFGITPAWWQILKGFSEVGVEVVAVPFVGRSVETPWWRTYQNPNLYKYLIYATCEKLLLRLGVYKNAMDFRQKNQRLLNYLVRSLAMKKWRSFLRKLVQNERDLDAAILFTVPLNFFTGLAKMLREHLNIPVIFYDGDTPTSLPKYGGLSLSFYNGADVSEYDGFIVNSKGVVDELREMGANKVYTVYWGVDPSFFSPLQDIERDIDVSFYGVGSKGREYWITEMLSKPSKMLEKYRFAVEGSGFDLDLGRVITYEGVPYRNFCCRSNICLNITRKGHAEVYGSSNSRIFELASMGCCIVSNPWRGIEEWFSVGKEVLVVSGMEEAVEVYEWLLSNPEERRKLGEAALKRLLKEHTVRHRVDQMLNIIKELS